ncbi:hypothetical protein JXQ70_10150 [bacterium]|nr:hypothetical protein [bacterium]
MPSFEKLVTFLDGDSDVWLFIWNLWWVDYALSSDQDSVMRTDYLYHPHELSLLFHSYSLLDGLMAYCLGFVLSNRLLIYNLLFFLSFFLTGLTSFQLCTYISRDWRAGFVGSMLFTFSPYHFLHALEHLNLMSIQWLPLAIYFLLRFKNEGQKRYLCGGLAVMVIIYFSTIYYALMIMLMYLLFLIIECGSTYWCNPVECGSQGLKRVFVYTFLSGLVLFMLVLPLLSTTVTSEYSPILLKETEIYSADLYSFFVSNPLQPIWGGPARRYLESLPGNIIEKGISPGLVALGLLVAAFFLVRRRDLVPWLVLTIVFAVLACGPFLMINGKQVTVLGKSVLLPFYVFQSVDFLNHFRAPARFAVIVSLCLALIGAQAVAVLGQRWSKWGPRKRLLLFRFLYCFVLGLVIAEFWSAPLPTLSGQFPEIYRQISRDAGDSVVLDVPLDHTIRKYQYYQTIHEHPLKMAFLARHPLDLIKNIRSDAVLRYVTDYRRKQPFTRPSPDAFQRALEVHRIGYLIIHRAYLSPERLLDLLCFMAPFRDKVIYDRQNIIVYRFNASESQSYR